MSAPTQDRPADDTATDEWPEIRFRVPPSWLQALRAAAEYQGLTVSSLLRLVIGPFVRERLQ